ncbi:MAG: hypothetical protein ACRDT6_04205 [Micromonosporaceae bacterium]
MSESTGDSAVERRLAAAERELRDRAVSDRYARFYAPLAVLAVVVTFLPLLEPGSRDGVTVTWGSLWEMAARHAGAPAVYALLLIGALVTLLVIASVRVRRSGLPIWIAVLSAVLLLMLWLKPGTGDWDPELAVGGVVGAVAGWIGIAVSAVHLVQLHRHRPLPSERELAAAVRRHNDLQGGV